MNSQTPPHQRTLRLATVCDERYRLGLAVMLQTAAESLALDMRLEVGVISLDLSEKSKARLTQTLQKALPGRASIRFESPVSVEGGNEFQEMLKRLNAPRHIRGYFSKLAAPQMFPTADRLLFLDADIYVGRDLAELFLQPMEKHPLKAVRDDLCPETFNSGVLLLDLKDWREKQRFKKSLELTLKLNAQLDKSLGIFSDQQVFNEQYRNNWENLGIEWNRQCIVTAGLFGELAEGKKRLFHYMTRPKPWELPEDPLWSQFYEALDRTAFSGWRPMPGWIHIRKRLSWWKYRLAKALNSLPGRKKAS